MDTASGAERTEGADAARADTDGDDTARREVGGYRLLRRIGSGGMGEVHEALDGEGRRVALKLLHPHVARQRASRVRLAREVSLLHRVRDPGVARVIDAEVEDTEAFVVTELVEGPTLEADVGEHGAFSGEEIVMLAHGLADALRAIHDAGIVHRDLKPGNVMLAGTGPVLIDFGIAQVVDDERLTQTGLVTGTPGYLDPEVLAGAEPAPACDWWAWAAVLVFASTARPPFGKGPTAAVLGRVATGRVDLSGIDPLLARALGAALSPDPAHRLDPATVLGVIDGEVDDRVLDAEIAWLAGHPPASAAHGVLAADTPTGVLPASQVHAGGGPVGGYVPDDAGGAAGHGSHRDESWARIAGHRPDAGDRFGVQGDVDRIGGAGGAGAGGHMDGGADGGRAVGGHVVAGQDGGGAYGAAPSHHESGDHRTRLAPTSTEAPRSYPPGGQESPRTRGRGAGPIGPLSLDRPEPSPYDRPGAGVAAYGNDQPPDGSVMQSFLGPDGRPPAWARPAVRRTGVAAAAGLALAALAPHAPGPFLLVLVGSVLLLATWGQADRSRRQARLRRGVRPGDTGRMVAALPWHAFVGVLSSSIGVVIGLVLAASVVLGAELLTGEPATPPALLLAGILAVCGVWLAPTAGNAREGLRSALAVIAPGRLARIILLAALLAVAVVAGALVLGGADVQPTWAPLPDLSALGGS